MTQILIIAGNVGDFLQADFDQGLLYWRPRDRRWFKSDRIHKSWNSTYAGAEALTYLDPHGYRCGRLFNKPLKAHRAIWAIATGAWPDCIDHINGNRADNRLCNLRSVSVADNNKNSRLRSDNQTGVVGVCWDASRQKWLATAEGRYIGRFDNVTDAIKARGEAERGLGFHENHGRAA